MSDTGDASGWPDVVGLSDRGDPWVRLSNAKAEIERLRADNEWLRGMIKNAIAAQDFTEARAAIAKEEGK